MDLKFRPLKQSFGAEVLGCDLASDMGDLAVAKLRDAWLDYGRLLFRDVDRSPEQHVAFTRRLGELHIMGPKQYNHPDHPEIFVLSNDVRNGRPMGMRKVGLGWHSDGETKPKPNAGSLLYALEIPPEGGDTLFAGVRAVYEALPERQK